MRTDKPRVRGVENYHVEPILPGDYNVETLCDVNDADLLVDRAKQLFPRQSLTLNKLWLRCVTYGSALKALIFSPRQPALRILDCSMFWFRSLKNRRVIPSKLSP